MARIFLSKADVGPAEEQAVLAALRSGWVAPLGPEVDKFEAETAARCGVGHALALSSGTAALHLALLAAGIKAGQIVVIPTMTFAATANAAHYIGAVPVFVDVSGDDGNLDPGLVVTAVDKLRGEGADIGAVMPVDLYGRCADYDAFVGELAEREIPVIEDAAEALGATYGDRSAASFGLAAALSFNGNKIMTTSGGGMLLSDNGDLVARARYLSTQARQPVPYYEHTEIGYNYRLSNLLAALGRAQLGRFDSLMARRRAIHQRYFDALSPLAGVGFLGQAARPSGSVDNCWLTGITLDPQTTKTTPMQLISALDEHDIEARHTWKPMHLQPVFADNRSFLTGAADRLFARGVMLPSGSELTDADIDRVIAAITEHLEGTK